jgi:hypothetical protein
MNLIKLRLRVATIKNPRGAEGFWLAELRVRQLKIGSKSCFAFIKLSLTLFQLLQLIQSKKIKEGVAKRQQKLPFRVGGAQK